MNNRFNILFLFTAFLILVFLIQFTALNEDGNIALYIFIYFEIFLLYLLAVYLVKKRAVMFRLPEAIIRPAAKLMQTEENLSLPLIIIITGILFRLVLFPTELTTSPDAYRYIWEGKVISNGYNPYELAPASPLLKNLHTADLPSKIHYPEKQTIYPPAAQLIFTMAYFISGENLWGLKFLYLIFEILTMFFLVRLLLLKRKSPDLVVIYAWLPLPLLEYFVNAHLDVSGISFFIMAVYFFEKEKYYWGSALFSFSVLTKFFPLFIFPLLFRKAGLTRTMIIGISVLLISLVFYLPFLTEGSNLFGHLALYIEKWEFNASVYYLLKIFTGGQAARIICAALFLTATGITAYYYKDFTKGALWIMMALLVFTSTVYPWYLGWVAVLSPVYTLYSVISLLLTSNLSNFTPLSPVWTEYSYILLAEYLTFFVLLGFDIRRQSKGAL